MAHNRPAGSPVTTTGKRELQNQNQRPQHGRSPDKRSEDDSQEEDDDDDE
jgi:hypothetical protein